MILAKRTYRIGAVLWLLAVLLSACAEEDRLPKIETDIPFRADGVAEFLRMDSTLITRIAVEIAEGDSARARGLMQRRNLPSRGGMLFVEDVADTQRFWMANTPIPLDLIFVAGDGRVVNVARGRPFSRENIVSTAPARYTVEVRAGFAERHGVGDSTLLRWWRLEE